MRTIQNRGRADRWWKFSVGHIRYTTNINKHLPPFKKNTKPKRLLSQNEETHTHTYKTEQLAFILLVAVIITLKLLYLWCQSCWAELTLSLSLSRSLLLQFMSFCVESTMIYWLALFLSRHKMLCAQKTKDTDSSIGRFFCEIAVIWFWKSKLTLLSRWQRFESSLENLQCSILLCLGTNDMISTEIIRRI